MGVRDGDRDKLGCQVMGYGAMSVIGCQVRPRATV